jgi:hypothetical protein
MQIIHVQNIVLQNNIVQNIDLLLRKLVKVTDMVLADGAGVKVG